MHYLLNFAYADPELPFSFHSCCWAFWPCFLALAPSICGSISPLKVKLTSQRPPKPSDWRSSTMIWSAVVLLSVWIFIHVMRLKSSRIFRFACSFLFLSLLPKSGPQKAPFARFICFWIARAPTVKMGGFWFPFNCSSVNNVYSLLNWRMSWFFSGGNSSSMLELVRRTPRHVRRPRGCNATKKSVSSF